MQTYSNPEILVERAIQFAIEAHWGQMYGTKPYIHHLYEVHDICTKFNLPVHVCAAAILHDVVEDTNVTADQVCAEFGYEVATLVYSVSDPDIKLTKEEELKLRTEQTISYKKYLRKRKKDVVYTKILAHPYGVHLKLADRIANVTACSTAKETRMFEMYCDEAAEFEKRLKTPNIAEDMWAKLDSVYGKYKTQSQPSGES